MEFEKYKKLASEHTARATQALAMLSKESALSASEYISRSQLLQVAARGNKPMSESIGLLTELPAQEHIDTRANRAWGESETRMFLDMIGHDQAVSGMSVIDSIKTSASEYVSVEQGGIDKVALALYTKISVNTDFKEIIPEGLDGITVKNIRLPYDVCWFSFKYFHEDVNILVTQDKETHELHYIDKTNSAVYYSLLASRHINLLDYELLAKEKCKDYELDIITACMAMDASGLSDTLVIHDMQLPPAPAKLNRTVKKQTIVVNFTRTTSISNRNTGRRSPREHWRRGYFRVRLGKRMWVKACLVAKGSIGIIIKDYILTKE